MFGNCQLGGMHMAFPDVCNTPTPVGPIPIPYPNLAFGPTGVPAAYNVLLCGGPAHNMTTQVPVSAGDNAGLMGGLISFMDMSTTKTLLPSFTVLNGGMPATKLTSITGQNGILLNSVGATLVPAQVTTLYLS
ncbi:MAG: DUF4150 domain-containing protein [Deltaproteobacteria bacterium]|nr:DUF4150 domain-containing protein [Deltaproteobacteria bacterium]